MYKFWYDSAKPKLVENIKLFSMNIDSFIVHLTTEDKCKDIAEDVETRFDTSKGKNKK